MLPSFWSHMVVGLRCLCQLLRWNHDEHLHEENVLILRYARRSTRRVSFKYACCLSSARELEPMISKREPTDAGRGPPVGRVSCTDFRAVQRTDWSSPDRFRNLLTPGLCITWYYGQKQASTSIPRTKSDSRVPSS
ncbi:hypothetical protein NL676_011560 [Syzygium grande]|nr:hypothetical protein NL676_011560 [Syzygium grande]